MFCLVTRYGEEDTRCVLVPDTGFHCQLPKYRYVDFIHHLVILFMVSDVNDLFGLKYNSDMLSTIIQLM